MSKIVKVTACVLLVPGIVFGLYIIMHGHLTPGGGFQGGAVIATISALLIVAYSDEIRGIMSRDILSIMESIALTAFIMLALLGLSATFFNNFMVNEGGLFGNMVSGINPGDLNTGGVIPLMNMAVGLEVYSALSLILVMMYFGSKKEVLEDAG